MIQGFKQLIADRALEDQFELKASFCLGECTRTGTQHPDSASGVAVQVDDRNYYLTPVDLNQFFDEVLLQKSPKKESGE